MTGSIANRNGKQEMGYTLYKKYWGKGYGTQLAKAILQYGFEILELKKIVAEVDCQNIASVKILDRTMNRKIGTFWNQIEQTYDYHYTLKNPNHANILQRCLK